MPMHQSVREEVIDNIWVGEDLKQYLKKCKKTLKLMQGFTVLALLILLLMQLGFFSDDSRLEELKTLLPSVEATSQFKLCPIDFEKVPLITPISWPVELLNFS